MSHFTVLVKVTPERTEKHNGNIKDAIEAMLIPYIETGTGNCPEEYVEFEDHTEEVLNTWENETTEMIRLADGELKWPHDDQFKVYEQGNPFNNKKSYPEDSEKVEVKYSEIYTDLDEFAQDYHGYKSNGEGRYGYDTNPNSKWDWYQIGGRWSDMLRIKEDAKSAERGSPSLLMDDYTPTPHTADLAQVKDIDFEGMELEVDVKIREWWEKYETYKKATDAGLSVDDLSEDYQGYEFGLHHILFKVGLKRCTKEREQILDDNGKPKEDENDRVMWTDPEFETDEFTLDDLLTTYRWYWEFGTFAVVDDDGWHEQGEMGWWGMSTDTSEDRENWSRNYVDKFLKNENPETHITIVDCHV